MGDGDFVRSSIIQRIKVTWQMILATFQRTLSLVFKNADGVLPAVSEVLQDEDKQLLARPMAC